LRILTISICIFYSTTGSSPNIIRMMKSRRMTWARNVARVGAKMNAYRILVGKPEGKRPLGRPKSRWVGNIKIDLREIGWDSMDRSGSGYGPVEGSCEHGDEPLGFIKCWGILK
jgi:hypothetical protein